MTTVTFAGTQVQGSFIARHMNAIVGRDDLAEVFGLSGASSIEGGLKPQQFDVVIELNNFATANAVFLYVQNTLHPLINTTGTLALAGTVNESLTNCKLQSVQKIDHQQQKGPSPSAVETNAWTEFVRLSFLQLA